MTRFTPILVSSAFAAVAAAPLAAQAVHWPGSSGGSDHWYEVVHVPGGITWTDAVDSAVVAGGHLVALGSSAENEFVHTLIMDPALWYRDALGDSWGPWIGGFQLPGSVEPAGSWMWVTGEAWNFNAWALGQPNDLGGEDNAHYFGNGFPNYASTWNDADGLELMLGYVIEYEQAPSIGVPYCTAVPNSTGQPAAISARGTAEVARNMLRLHTTMMPKGSFGYFLTSRTTGFVPNPGGSVGNLCLGGSIGRYVGPGQIRHSGATGEIHLHLDLMKTPTPTALVAVLPGETWYFTTWFRDVAMGTPTSNLSNGVGVTFF